MKHAMSQFYELDEEQLYEPERQSYMERMIYDYNTEEERYYNYAKKYQFDIEQQYEQDFNDQVSLRSFPWDTERNSHDWRSHDLHRESYNAYEKLPGRKRNITENHLYDISPKRDKWARTRPIEIVSTRRPGKHKRSQYRSYINRNDSAFRERNGHSHFRKELHNSKTLEGPDKYHNKKHKTDSNSSTPNIEKKANNEKKEMHDSEAHTENALSSLQEKHITDVKDKEIHDHEIVKCDIDELAKMDCYTTEGSLDLPKNNSLKSPLIRTEKISKAHNAELKQLKCTERDTCISEENTVIQDKTKEAENTANFAAFKSICGSEQKTEMKINEEKGICEASHSDCVQGDKIEEKHRLLQNESEERECHVSEHNKCEEKQMPNVLRDKCNNSSAEEKKLVESKTLLDDTSKPVFNSRTSEKDQHYNSSAQDQTSIQQIDQDSLHSASTEREQSGQNESELFEDETYRQQSHQDLQHSTDETYRQQSHQDLQHSTKTRDSNPNESIPCEGLQSIEEKQSGFAKHSKTNDEVDVTADLSEKAVKNISGNSITTEQHGSIRPLGFAHKILSRRQCLPPEYYVTFDQHYGKNETPNIENPGKRFVKCSDELEGGNILTSKGMTNDCKELLENKESTPSEYEFVKGNKISDKCQSRNLSNAVGGATKEVIQDTNQEGKTSSSILIKPNCEGFIEEIKANKNKDSGVNESGSSLECDVGLKDAKNKNIKSTDKEIGLPNTRNDGHFKNKNALFIEEKTTRNAEKERKAIDRAFQNRIKTSEFLKHNKQSMENKNTSPSVKDKDKTAENSSGCSVPRSCSINKLKRSYSEQANKTAANDKSLVYSKKCKRRKSDGEENSMKITGSIKSQDLANGKIENRDKILDLCGHENLLHSVTPRNIEHAEEKIKGKDVGHSSSGNTSDKSGNQLLGDSDKIKNVTSMDISDASENLTLSPTVRERMINLFGDDEIIKQHDILPLADNMLPCISSSDNACSVLYSSSMNQMPNGNLTNSSECKDVAQLEEEQKTSSLITSNESKQNELENENAVNENMHCAQALNTHEVNDISGIKSNVHFIEETAIAKMAEMTSTVESDCSPEGESTVTCKELLHHMDVDLDAAENVELMATGENKNELETEKHNIQSTTEPLPKHIDDLKESYRKEEEKTNVDLDTAESLKLMATRGDKNELETERNGIGNLSTTTETLSKHMNGLKGNYRKEEEKPAVSGMPDTASVLKVTSLTRYEEEEDDDLEIIEVILNKENNQKESIKYEDKTTNNFNKRNFGIHRKMVKTKNDCFVDQGQDLNDIDVQEVNDKELHKENMTSLDVMANSLIASNNCDVMQEVDISTPRADSSSSEQIPTSVTEMKNTECTAVKPRIRVRDVTTMQVPFFAKMDNKVAKTAELIFLLLRAFARFKERSISASALSEKLKKSEIEMAINEFKRSAEPFKEIVELFSELHAELNNQTIPVLTLRLNNMAAPKVYLETELEKAVNFARLMSCRANNTNTVTQEQCQNQKNKENAHSEHNISNSLQQPTQECGSILNQHSDIVQYVPAVNAASVGIMSSNAQSGQIQMETVAQNINSHAQNINSHAQNINSSVQNINSNSHAQSINSHTQSINSQAQSINSHTQSINSRAQSINSHAQNINSHAQNINSSVQNINSNSHAQSINSHTQSINSHTQSINSRAQSINSQSSNPKQRELASQRSGIPHPPVTSSNVMSSHNVAFFPHVIQQDQPFNACNITPQVNRPNYSAMTNSFSQHSGNMFQGFSEQSQRSAKQFCAQPQVSSIMVLNGIVNNMQVEPVNYLQQTYSRQMSAPINQGFQLNAQAGTNQNRSQDFTLQRRAQQHNVEVSQSLHSLLNKPTSNNVQQNVAYMPLRQHVQNDHTNAHRFNVALNNSTVNTAGLLQHQKSNENCTMPASSQNHSFAVPPPSYPSWQRENQNIESGVRRDYQLNTASFISGNYNRIVPPTASLWNQTDKGRSNNIRAVQPHFQTSIADPASHNEAIADISPDRRERLKVTKRRNEISSIGTSSNHPGFTPYMWQQMPNLTPVSGKFSRSASQPTNMPWCPRCPNGSTSRDSRNYNSYTHTVSSQFHVALNNISGHKDTSSIRAHNSRAIETTANSNVASIHGVGNGKQISAQKLHPGLQFTGSLQKEGTMVNAVGNLNIHSTHNSSSGNWKQIGCRSENSIASSSGSGNWKQIGYQSESVSVENSVASSVLPNPKNTQICSPLITAAEYRTSLPNTATLVLPENSRMYRVSSNNATAISANEMNKELQYSSTGSNPEPLLRTCTSNIEVRKAVSDKESTLQQRNNTSLSATSVPNVMEQISVNAGMVTSPLDGVEKQCTAEKITKNLQQKPMLRCSAESAPESSNGDETGLHFATGSLFNIGAQEVSRPMASVDTMKNSSPNVANNTSRAEQTFSTGSAVASAMQSSASIGVCSGSIMDSACTTNSVSRPSSSVTAETDTSCVKDGSLNADIVISQSSDGVHLAVAGHSANKDYEENSVMNENAVSRADSAHEELQVELYENVQPRTLSRDSGYRTPSPEVATHDEDGNDILCATCGKEAKLMCAICRTQCYCGEECQRKDWKYNHYLDCKIHDEDDD